MKLAKAVQIAVESIRLQRLKITFDASMFKIYHSDNARNRACAELYERYTEAIELLNSLVINSDPAVYRSITNELVTNSLSQAPDPGTMGTETPAPDRDPATMVTKPDQHLVDPFSSHQLVHRDIERRR
jgi:hypothetical protein